MTTTTLEPAPATRRSRRGLKRTKFLVPRKAMSLPIRALWDQASPEQQERAHRCAVEVLQCWLGKASRAEAARRLEMPPLRFWQLSQQAVAGMVAGLLRQPRARRGRAPASPAEADARTLSKRIAGLEKDLSEARSLIAILRELPAHREARERESGDGSSPRTAMAARDEGTAGRIVAIGPPRRARSARARPRDQRKDAAELGGDGAK